MAGSIYEKYGRFYGWKFLAAVWVIYCLMQGIVLYGASVVNTFAMMDIGASRGELGLATTVYQICGSCASPFVTWLINKRGIRLSMTLGAIVIIVSCVILAVGVVSGIGYVAVYGMLTGLGMSMAGMLPLQVGVNHWFREKRALAMAISLTGSGVGGFVSGAIFTFINGAFGWRACWWFVAGTTLIAIVVVVLFVVNKPEDIGQVPDGNPLEEAHGGARSTTGFSRVFKVVGNIPIKAVLRDYRVWAIVVSLVFMRFSYNICVTQGMAHLLDQGLDTAVAASAVGSMTLLGVIGRLGAGFVGDKVEPRFIWAAGMVVMGAGIVAIWFASSPTHVWLFALGVGVGFGFAYVMSTVLIANYYGADTYTGLMAFMFPAQFILGSLGPTFAGVAYDTFGSYSPAFFVSLIVVGVSVVFVLAAAPPKKLAAENGVEILVRKDG